MTDATTEPRSLARDVSLVLAAWALSLGFDFFLHGGLLARLYARDSAFLLPPESAFARIPAPAHSIAICWVSMMIAALLGL